MLLHSVVPQDFSPAQSAKRGSNERLGSTSFFVAKMSLCPHDGLIERDVRFATHCSAICCFRRMACTFPFKRSFWRWQPSSLRTPFVEIRLLCIDSQSLRFSISIRSFIIQEKKRAFTPLESTNCQFRPVSAYMYIPSSPITPSTPSLLSLVFVGHDVTTNDHFWSEKGSE